MKLHTTITLCWHLNKHITDHFYVSPLYKKNGINTIILSKHSFVELGKNHRGRSSLNVGEGSEIKHLFINPKIAIGLFTAIHNINESNEENKENEHREWCK